MKHLLPEQVQKLIEAADGERNKLLFTMLLSRPSFDPIMSLRLMMSPSSEAPYQGTASLGISAIRGMGADHTFLPEICVLI